MKSKRANQELTELKKRIADHILQTQAIKDSQAPDQAHTMREWNLRTAFNLMMDGQLRSLAEIAKCADGLGR